MKSNLQRIHFYSVHDGATGHELRNAENVLKRLDLSNSHDVNDFLEGFHIKKYFDHNLFLSTWNEEFKATSVGLVNQFYELAKVFFLSLDNDSFPLQLSNVEYSYRTEFWELTNKWSLYKNISRETFKDILNSDNHNTRHIQDY